jgi:hypothetical protein
MLKKCIYSLALLAGFCNAGDFYDVQGNYLNRDLGVNDQYDPATTLKNYQIAVVQNVYGKTPAEFTIADWKTENKFPTDGSLLNAEYYNSADLGLGRNMNCWPQPGLKGARGKDAMACYVSNHGKIGAGHEAAFQGLNCNTAQDKIANTPNDFSKEFATVAMEYWPEAPKNKVRFFVFGAEADGGKLVTSLNIALDNGLGHEQPGLCLSCHGGEIKTANSANTIDIQGAHFLPFDTFSFEFETPEKRLAATPIFDEMNKLVHAAEKATYEADVAENQQIFKFLTGSYTPNIEDANAKMVDTYTPPEFDPEKTEKITVNDKNLYHTVAKHYCRGCHLASSHILSPSDVKDTVCNPESDMPHAEVTHANLLRHMEFVADDMDRHFQIKTCYTMPHLIDFQHAIPPFSFSAIEKGKIVPSRYSMVLAGQDINTKLNGELINEGDPVTATIDAHKPGIGINNHKRAFRFEPYYGSAVAFRKSDQPNSPAITKLSLLTLHDKNQGGLSSDGERLIAGSSIGIPGANLEGKSSALFEQYLFDRSTRNESQIVLNPVSRVSSSLPASQVIGNWDIDDILVTYQDQQTGATYQDFENSIMPITRQFPVTSLADCTSDSFQRFLRVGNLIKPDSDTGRYTYHTPPQLCVGDYFVMSPTFLLPVKNVPLKEFSFDFVISKKIRVGGPYLDPILNARLNGTLVETADAFHGRVTVLNATSSATLVMNFRVLEDSGINGKPIHGVAIDNIRAIQ